jgi:hypothetical protein
VLPSPSSTPSYAKQLIRVYQANENPNLENFAEMAFEIGALPDHIEVITQYPLFSEHEMRITLSIFRFKTSIESQGNFFSDNNGVIHFLIANNYSIFWCRV